MKISYSATTKIVLASLLFAAVCGVALVVFMLVVRADAAELVTAVERVAVEEAESQGKIQVSNLFTESVDERAELRQFVLTEDRLIDFVSEIEQIGTEQQVEFETKRIENNSDEDEAFGEYAIEVSFEGTKASVDAVITILESLPYHGHVHRIAMQGNRQIWKADVSLRLTVIAYDR